PGPQTEARTTLGWDPDDRVILFNAKRDARNKGLDLAEAAMNFVRAKLPSARMHILSNVQPDSMPIYYRAADLLLCTSMQEGSPNGVKEALAFNLHIVSVPVGDVPERLKDVSPSAIVPRDPVVISEAVVRILTTRGRSNGRDSILGLSM